MLVRNLTSGSLKMSSITTGKRIVLPPMKVIEIDELEYPAERLKKIYGRYVQILTEKVEEPQNVPTEPEKDLGTEESGSTLPPSDETPAKNEKDEDNGGEGNAPDANPENSADDADNIDQLVDEVLEEIETGDTKEEKPVEEKSAKKSNKAGKKANKKNK